MPYAMHLSSAKQCPPGLDQSGYQRRQVRQRERNEALLPNSQAPLAESPQEAVTRRQLGRH
jgi:hypothetical protein